MGALPKPEVADGPVRMLFDELHDLHHRAGWPSLRDMAKDVGCSHTTVSVAFSGPRVPRWGLLELIVEALGGDTGRMHLLWLAASQAQHPAPGTGAGSEPAGPASGGQPPTDVPLPRGPVPHAPPVPRELPADVVPFTGRTHQLAELDRLLESVDGTGPAAGLVVLSGTAGVGKTALAVRWAHRVADRFPDGQLYVNLRGYDPDRPVPPADVLAAFLRVLGLDGAAVPGELAERAARYRTLLAGKRMLVLLDNAHSVDQVRDLLPGASSCLTLVTSRHALPALVARHGAVRVRLDLLSPAEAVSLLRALIGGRVDAEPEQAVTLAQRCARLPLALRVAAELAGSRSLSSLAQLVAELGDEQRRLDLLAAGQDEYTALRAVFSWSYQQLTAPAARAFALLGHYPGQDIDGYAAAAVAGTDLAGAHRLLDELARAHLIEETRPGRFGMHDLLRAYAAEQSAQCSAEDRRSALTRLLDYHLHAAGAAVRTGIPGSRPPGGSPAGPVPDFPGAAEARAWLDLERANLLAAAELAGVHRLPHVGQLASVIAGYLDTRAYYQDVLALADLALRTARDRADRAAEASALSLLATAYRRLGDYAAARQRYEQALAIDVAADDRAGQAAALHGLGILDWRQGRYGPAAERLDAALGTYRDLADRGGQGSALHGLGIVYRRLGRYADAVAHYEQALELHRAAADRAAEARTLGNLGVVYLRLGRYDEALRHGERSLAIHRELGDRAGVGVALTNVAAAYERLDRLDEAGEHFAEALDRYRAAGYRVGEGDALHGLGLVYRRAGRHAEAVDRLRQAVAIGQDLSELDLVAGALNDLGESLRATGQSDDAMDAYAGARELSTQTGDRYEQARACDGIAHLHSARGEPAQAAQLWRLALDIYAELGVPEQAEVRRLLGAT